MSNVASPRRGPGRPPTGRRNVRVKTELFPDENEVFKELCQVLGIKGEPLIRNLILREAAANGLAVPRVPAQQMPLDLEEAPIAA